MAQDVGIAVSVALLSRLSMATLWDTESYELGRMFQMDLLWVYDQSESPLEEAMRP